MKLWWKKPVVSVSGREARDGRGYRVGIRESRGGMPVADEAQLRILSRILIGAGPDHDGSSCWQWTGSVSNAGYGLMSYRGVMRTTHRLAYELFRGPIPVGLQIDHLCRSRTCVNPGHLEPVTASVNVARAKGNHCKRGHELSPANIYISKSGSRVCLACSKARCFARRHGLNVEDVVRDVAQRDQVAI